MNVDTQDKLIFWLRAALDDVKTPLAMKNDIHAWFVALEAAAQAALDRAKDKALRGKK